MLLTKEVPLMLNGRNVNYLENLGYFIPRYRDDRGRLVVKRGTVIMVKVEDLPVGSHAKVLTQCDYCGTIKENTYKDYLKRHDNKLGDCCPKCRKIKWENTMLEKYGTTASFDIPGVKEKVVRTNQIKYGCDWQMQSILVQEKSKETMKEKYGVEHALQNPEFFEKMWNTMLQNGHSHVSKPQQEIYNILKELYEDCEQEVPCGKCSLDCVVSLDGIKIDVEYDGWFWHQDKYRDIKRDNFIKKNGYKIFRIKGCKGDILPSKEQLEFHINKLLGKYTYTELIMK